LILRHATCFYSFCGLEIERAIEDKVFVKIPEWICGFLMFWGTSRARVIKSIDDSHELQSAGSLLVRRMEKGKETGYSPTWRSL
jgi:hypothetical protein